MKPINLYLAGGLLALTSLTSISAEVFSRGSDTFYISPLGLDTNDGLSQDYPVASWTEALSRLGAGDTLIVMDGIWTKDSCNGTLKCLQVSQLLEANCKTPDHSSGTALAPVVIRAQNQRKALLASNGGSAIKLQYCDHWQVDGLYAKSRDNKDISQASVVWADHAEYIDFKNLLVRHPNRYHNTHLVQLTDTDHSTVSRSELYDFHRHGISVSSGSDHNVTRLNYINSRYYGDLDEKDAEDSHLSDMGDECITFYATDSNRSENDIAVACEGIQATGARNKILGGIVYQADDGFRIASNCQDSGGEQLCYDPDEYPIERYIAHDNLVKDSVAFHIRDTAFDCISSQGCQFENFTVADAQTFNVVIRDNIKTSSGGSEFGRGYFNPSATMRNGISIKTGYWPTDGGAGFVVAELEDTCTNAIDGSNCIDYEFCSGLNDWCDADRVRDVGHPELWLGDNLLAWSNATTDEGVLFSHSGDVGGKGNTPEYGEYDRTEVANPLMSQCYLDFDESSVSLSKLDVSSELGANALYQYVDGVRTGLPVFDRKTGDFEGCGAQVQGVNDGLGSCQAAKYTLRTVPNTLGSCNYYQ